MGKGRVKGWAVAAGLAARALRLGAPQPASSLERLRAMPVRNLPLQAPVAIRWNPSLVPFIRAQHDRDLAVALGAVHAHLRLSQMEAMRRLARGRVAELIGPLGIELDRALRLMQFDRATNGIVAMLPDATRLWAEGFVAGVNHHLAHAKRLPHEFQLFDVRPEPWTLSDLITVARFAATDVSWLVFGRLLRAQAAMDAAEWDALWPLLLGGDALLDPPLPTGAGKAAWGLLRGSNSAAVAARRSSTGAALIASDPHLSITLPPLWLIAGLHAPGIQAVGLMLPGLPVIGLGRNPWIAWGGTSLHAASSELIDVSGEKVTRREETIAVRGATGSTRPVTLSLPETRFGPVVSEGMLLRADRPLALRWVGHRASDELSAMLGVMRARDIEAFRAALAGFAVPGQTMVCAGVDGRVARVIAAHLPRRSPGLPEGMVCTPAEAWSLDDLVVGAAFASGPPEEIVVSANDRPHTPVPVGFFFSRPDRAARMRALLSADRVTPAQMRALQTDVTQPAALVLRDALLARMPPPRQREREALAILAAWDGSYAVASRGALVFEVLVANLTRSLVPRRRLRVLLAIWTGRALIGREVARAPERLLANGLKAAARMLRRYHCWGNLHRLRLAHPLAVIPVLGRRYGLVFPAAGGNDTLNKTGHGMATGRHWVTYGACARHVSDLSDPDDNRLVLLGGQDGWLGSAHAADQVALWRAGAYLTVPLRPHAAETWPHRTELTP